METSNDTNIFSGKKHRKGLVEIGHHFSVVERNSRVKEAVITYSANTYAARDDGGTGGRTEKEEGAAAEARGAPFPSPSSWHGMGKRETEGGGGGGGVTGKTEGGREGPTGGGGRSGGKTERSPLRSNRG